MVTQINGDNICKRLGSGSLYLPSFMEFVTSLNLIRVIRLVSFLLHDSVNSLSAYFCVSQRTEHKALHLVRAKLTIYQMKREKDSIFYTYCLYYF